MKLTLRLRMKLAEMHALFGKRDLFLLVRIHVYLILYFCLFQNRQIKKFIFILFIMFQFLFFHKIEINSFLGQ